MTNAVLQDLSIAAATPERTNIRCSMAGHGYLLRRSAAMGDYYCCNCRARHLETYVLRPTPGRRLIVAEALRRGGACQFVMLYPHGEQVRCAARFEYGQLQWHHRDPSQKIATIAALADGPNREILLAELAKCDLLCRPHHRVVQRIIPTPDGDREEREWTIIRD